MKWAARYLAAWKSRGAAELRWVFPLISAKEKSADRVTGLPNWLEGRKRERKGDQKAEKF
jgi:hypothetical protein